MNETILKFGYPNSLIKEYNSWMVLLRPQQATLGSLILAYKPDVKRLSEVSPEGFSELSRISMEIETLLKNLFGMEKINYLALMMVDKNVHFHVIPRYSINVMFNKKEFVDNGWPKLPDLTYNNNLNNNDLLKLKETLIESFNQKFNSVDYKIKI